MPMGMMGNAIGAAGGSMRKPAGKMGLGPSQGMQGGMQGGMQRPQMGGGVGQVGRMGQQGQGPPQQSGFMGAAQGLARMGGNMGMKPPGGGMMRPPMQASGQPPMQQPQLPPMMGGGPGAPIDNGGAMQDMAMQKQQAMMQQPQGIGPRPQMMNRMGGPRRPMY